MDLGCIKTNIMSLTESIMLFHREAFPMSYQFAGCAPIRQQLSPLSNKKWARVKVKYKRLVISYTRPLSTIAIIARRTFLLSIVQSYCSFPPPPRSPSRRLTKCPMQLFNGGEIFNHTFPEEILIFVCNLSFN